MRSLAKRGSEEPLWSLLAGGEPNPCISRPAARSSPEATMALDPLNTSVEAEQRPNVTPMGSAPDPLAVGAELVAVLPGEINSYFISAIPDDPSAVGLYRHNHCKRQR
jgi:hypothetical protein